MVTTHHPGQTVAAHRMGRTVVKHHLTEVGEEVQETGIDRHGLRSTMIESGYHQVYARSVVRGIICGAHGRRHARTVNKWATRRWYASRGYGIKEPVCIRNDYPQTALRLGLLQGR
jgi:hypothetical protein